MLQSWFGIIRSLDDALCLIEAARTGIIPRVTRRLTEKERNLLIRPGAVFIFEETESQVRRWADALLWSSSRIKGHFLIYKELDPASEKEHIHPAQSPPSNMPSKAFTLKKKSLSLTTNDGQKLRLISYYRDVDVNQLPTVETDPRFAEIYIPDNLYWSSNDTLVAPSRKTRRRAAGWNQAAPAGSFTPDQQCSSGYCTPTPRPADPYRSPVPGYGDRLSVTMSPGSPALRRHRDWQGDGSPFIRNMSISTTSSRPESLTPTERHRGIPMSWSPSPRSTQVSSTRTPSPPRSPSKTTSPEFCTHPPNAMSMCSTPPTISLPVIDNQAFKLSGFKYAHIQDAADKKLLLSLDQNLSTDFRNSVH